MTKTEHNMSVWFILPTPEGEIMFEPEYAVARYMVPGDVCKLCIDWGARVTREEFVVSRRTWDGSELRIYLVK